MESDPEYERWLETVPADITSDTLWRMAAYRFALYAMSRAQADVRYIVRHRETRGLVDQMIRAVGGMSANLEEGYGRSGAHDRAHFYEYALCTARESRGWYYKCAIALPADLLATRMGRLTQIIRILTVVVPQERESELRWNTKRRKRGQDSPPDSPQYQ